MIEVERLTKQYGTFTAVDGISFKVEKGQILGFLGPNGAGKTTTMRILTSYLPANSGTARIDGFDVGTDPMEVKRRIGYLPENPPVYNDMTVTEYISFCAELRGMAAAEQTSAVDRTMDRCGLGDRRKQLIGTLSKGFRQRVGLAQALVHDPPVLVLDEPTIGLDPAQIIEIRELIKGLSSDHTVILSTHILPEVSVTCEAVVIIHEGRIRLADTLENLAKAGAESLEETFLRVISSDVEEVATQ